MDIHKKAKWACWLYCAVILLIAAFVFGVGMYTIVDWLS